MVPGFEGADFAYGVIEAVYALLPYAAYAFEAALDAADGVTDIGAVYDLFVWLRRKLRPRTNSRAEKRPTARDRPRRPRGKQRRPARSPRRVKQRGSRPPPREATPHRRRQEERPTFRGSASLRLGRAGIESRTLVGGKNSR
jgi:hypothetical protein